MPDFFAESILGDVAQFSPEDSHHALKVLRLREGEALGVSYQGKRYLANLILDGQTAKARIQSETKSTEAKTRITLYQGWPKGDKMEQIVRQGTELGVHRIVPVLFSRCVVKPDGNKRLERLNKIAREAAMQSKRTLIPSIEDTLDFITFKEQLKTHELALVPYELENNRSLREAYTGQADIALVIGPEGGLTADEVGQMDAAAVTLGPRIFRTETAGIAAIAMILALNNDFL